MADVIFSLILATSELPPPFLALLCAGDIYVMYVVSDVVMVVA